MEMDNQTKLYISIFFAIMNFKTNLYSNLTTINEGAQLKSGFKLSKSL